jgi:hypothetical protein
MDKIALNLELTEQQAGYLVAAVIELHHNLCRASTYDYLHNETQEKIKAVKDMWLEIEKQTGIA